ncbi:E3 ubiquitin-protein ligase rfwd3.L-like [Glandiceps talaboti]
MATNEELMEVDTGDRNQSSPDIHDNDDTVVTYDPEEDEADTESESENEGSQSRVRNQAAGQSERLTAQGFYPNVVIIQQPDEDSDETIIDSGESLFGDDEDDDSNTSHQVPHRTFAGNQEIQIDQSVQQTVQVNQSEQETVPSTLAASTSASQSQSGSHSQSLLPERNSQPLNRTRSHDDPVDQLQPSTAQQQGVDESRGHMSRVEQSIADNTGNIQPRNSQQDTSSTGQAVGNVHANVSLINTSIQSPNNFQTPKKAIFSPEKDDESECCSICFDSWTNSGAHRLASLKCGHLFGQSCIEKWLKGHGGKCPQCNAKAKKSEIRVIYAKAVRALDTTERDRALKELEKEKELRRKVELEAAQLRMQCQLALEECSRLKAQVRVQDKYPVMQARPGPSSAHGSISGSQPSSMGQYKLEKTIPICPNGGCRVMAFDPSRQVLVVSMPSPNQLFPGHGVKKISMFDMKSSQYVTIHNKMLRDCCFNNRNDGLLLTTSIDKTVKITSVLSNTVVQTYTCQVPVWSCAWNLDDTNYIYAGLQNGSVVMYDTRNTNTEVTQFNRDGSRCPIVSLQYVESNINSTFRCSGLLTGTLEGAQFWEKRNAADYTPHILPFEGNCTCLSFEPSTRHCLASFRPNRNHPTARHVMYELQYTQLPGLGNGSTSTCTCNEVQSFYGGSSMKLLTRSKLFPSPADHSKILACAGDEASLSAHIWDGSTGNLQQKLSANAPVLDVCPFTLNNQHRLAIMTEKIVKIHSC